MRSRAGEVRMMGFNNKDSRTIPIFSQIHLSTCVLFGHKQRFRQCDMPAQSLAKICVN